MHANIAVGDEHVCKQCNGFNQGKAPDRRRRPMVRESCSKREPSGSQSCSIACWRMALARRGMLGRQRARAAWTNGGNHAGLGGAEAAAACRSAPSAGTRLHRASRSPTARSRPASAPVANRDRLQEAARASFEVNWIAPPEKSKARPYRRAVEPLLPSDKVDRPDGALAERAAQVKPVSTLSGRPTSVSSAIGAFR